MILVIRFIGVANAAIWLGAAVFCAFVAAPAFRLSEVNALGLHVFWRGAMLQEVFARSFYLQYLCGAVALVHLLAEWVYLGRALQRGTMSLLVSLLCISLMGGLWFQPKLNSLHCTKYSMNEEYQRITVPPEEARRAARSFRIWHNIASAVDLVAIGGLAAYFWRMTHPPDNLRFVSTTKFRS